MADLFDGHLHEIPAEEAIALLGSDAEKGLDLFEIQARQEKYGPNSLPMQVGHGPR